LAVAGAVALEAGLAALDSAPAMLANDSGAPVRLTGLAPPLTGALCCVLDGLHEMMTPSDSLSESMVMLWASAGRLKHT
jgi:hypothetical protein